MKPFQVIILIVLVFVVYTKVLTPAQQGQVTAPINGLLPTALVIQPKVDGKPAIVIPRGSVSLGNGGGTVPSTNKPLCSMTADQNNCNPDPVPAVDIQPTLAAQATAFATAHEPKGDVYGPQQSIIGPIQDEPALVIMPTSIPDAAASAVLPACEYHIKSNKYTTNACDHWKSIINVED